MRTVCRATCVEFPSCLTALSPQITPPTTKVRFLHVPLHLALAFAGLFFCAFAAFGQEPAAPPTSQAVSQAVRNGAVAPRINSDMLAEIEKSGKLRVGVSEIVPWAMHDKDGKLVGFEIDVARKLARDLGVQVEFYPEEFRYLISDLQAGRFDIIISGFSIEADRALQVNFSAPYNSTDVTLAANTKTAGGFKTLQEFNKPEITIGALEGTTAEEMTSILVPDAKIKTYTQDSELFDDLIAGKLDAAVADSPRPEIVAKLFPASVTFPPIPPLATFPAAFAVRRGDMDFVNFLNSWIAARTVNQWLESRRHYWFKTTDWGKDL